MASAKVEVTRSVTVPLDEAVKVSEDMLRELGLLMREEIVRDTLSGRDAQGQPFQPYSEGYAKQKRAALGSDFVNLQVSGNMLNHLTITDVAVESAGSKGTVTLGWNQ